MKKLTTLLFAVIILFSCQKQNILPYSASKCGTVTSKTEFKGKYLIFIDGIGFEFTRIEWERSNMGEKKCTIPFFNK